MPDMPHTGREPAAVAMLCQGTESYGVQRVVLDLLTSIEGVRLACVERGELFEAADRADMKPVLIPDLEAFDPYMLRLKQMASLVPVMRRNARRIARWCEGEGIRILHSHQLAHHLMGGFAADFGSPWLHSVWHIHIFPGRGRLGWLTRELHRCAGLRWADRIITISDAVSRSYRSVLRSHVRVVHNGLRLPPPGNAEEVDCLRAEYHRWKPVVLCWAGRLVPIKGLHVAIEALRLLGRSDVGLIVLGDTLKRSYQVEDYRGRVEAIINKAGLTDQVRFLGHVDNAIEQMGACDIAVHTRIDPEAFGLVIIEAQAAGCAVIGTRAGGVPEIVEDGISGLLVKPQNPAALQQAIQYLLDDPPGRSRIAAEGRRRVLRYYGLERVATEVCTVYEELGVAGARPSTVLHGVPASDASRESSDG